MMYDTHEKETTEDEEIIEEGTIDTDVSLEDEEARSTDKIKQLQAKLKESESARAALQEDLQRAKAEFLNAKKRLLEQQTVDLERAADKHLEAILSLADSFEMAMKSPTWSTADEVWRKGVEGIYTQLTGIIKNAGLTTIDPTGAAFDPHEHEALMGEGETVSEVYQKGYKRGETVFRPAKVAVN